MLPQGNNISISVSTLDCLGAPSILQHSLGPLTVASALPAAITSSISQVTHSGPRVVQQITPLKSFAMQAIASLNSSSATVPSETVLAQYVLTAYTASQALTGMNGAQASSLRSRIIRYVAEGHKSAHWPAKLPTPHSTSNLICRLLDLVTSAQADVSNIVAGSIARYVPMR